MAGNIDGILQHIARATKKGPVRGCPFHEETAKEIEKVMFTAFHVSQGKLQPEIVER